jgi:hypothetical protein
MRWYTIMPQQGGGMSGRVVIRRIVGLLVTIGAPTPAGAQNQNDQADAARLVEVLQLGDGSRVADIGAGAGVLTLLVAQRDSRVMATIGAFRVVTERDLEAVRDRIGTHATTPWTTSATRA